MPLGDSVTAAHFQKPIIAYLARLRADLIMVLARLLSERSRFESWSPNRLIRAD